MANILIIAEHEGGKLKAYSKELAGKASELASQAGGKAHGVVVGNEVSTVAEELGQYSIAQAFAIEGSELEPYRGEVYAKVLERLIQNLKPQIVLASASSFGKDVLPRLAMRFKAGLATDCIDLQIENGKLKARRPIFAGKALVDVSFLSDLQFATARPNSFALKTPSTSQKTPGQKIPANGEESRVRVKEIKEAEKGMKDLTEAEIIVSGGRALGNSENFKYIRELAGVLGATVGASRAAVDAGYISHDHQVGQTGKTVNPKLYIACGISGAIQHLAGMRTAKVIVAINKDPEAPLFGKADYGIVGDLFVLLPILTKKFKELLGKS